MKAEVIKSIIVGLEETNFPVVINLLKEARISNEINHNFFIASYLTYDLMKSFADHKLQSVKLYNRLRKYHLNKLIKIYGSEDIAWYEISQFLYNYSRKLEIFLWFDRQMLLNKYIDKALAIEPDNIKYKFFKHEYAGNTGRCIELLKANSYQEGFGDRYLRKVTCNKNIDSIKFNYIQEIFSQEKEYELFHTYYSSLEDFKGLYNLFIKHPKLKKSYIHYKYNFEYVCFKLKKYKEVIDSFSISYYSKEFKDFILLGNCYLKTKEIPTAIEYYKKAYFEPNDLSCLFNDDIDIIPKLFKLKEYILIDEILNELESTEKNIDSRKWVIELYRAELLYFDKKYMASLDLLDKVKLLTEKSNANLKNNELNYFYALNNYELTLDMLTKEYNNLLQGKNYNLVGWLTFDFKVYNVYKDFISYMEKLYLESNNKKYLVKKTHLISKIEKRSQELLKKLYSEAKKMSFVLDDKIELFYLSLFDGQEELNKRINYYVNKLKITPNNTKLNLNLGLLYSHIKDYVSAEKYLLKAIYFENKELDYLNGVPQLELIKVNNLLHTDGKILLENKALFEKTIKSYIAHRSIVKHVGEISFIKTLYKYKSFSMNTVSSLANNYLYFANREALNDPFELNTDLIEILLDKVSIDNNLFKIFSISRVNNNSLMWSHYADEHKGICIGYSIEYLPSVMCKELVRYKDNRLEKKETFDSIIHYMQTKDKCWKYEKEIRLLYHGEESKHEYCFSKDVGVDKHKIVLKIKEIILGLKFEHSNEQVLKPILNEIEKQQNQKIKVLKAYKNTEKPLKLDIRDYEF